MFGRFETWTTCFGISWKDHISINGSILLEKSQVLDNSFITQNIIFLSFLLWQLSIDLHCFSLILMLLLIKKPALFLNRIFVFLSRVLGFCFFFLWCFLNMKKRFCIQKQNIEKRNRDFGNKEIRATCRIYKQVEHLYFVFWSFMFPPLISHRELPNLIISNI